MMYRYIAAACDDGCTKCDTNKAGNCDGQAFCPTNTYFDDSSKKCEGEHITAELVILVY